MRIKSDDDKGGERTKGAKFKSRKSQGSNFQSKPGSELKKDQAQAETQRHKTRGTGTKKTLSILG